MLGAPQDQGWHQVTKAWWISSIAKSPRAQHSLLGKPHSDAAGTGDTAERGLYLVSEKPDFEIHPFHCEFGHSS